ncbi:hypothetical protein EV174_004137, partial [Coemansia sp. RSA 2320]
MRGSGYYPRGGGAAANSRASSYHRGPGGNAHDDRDHKEKKKRDAIFDIKKYTDKQIRVKFMGGRE